MENETLIRIGEVQGICGIGKSEIYQQLSLGNFPKPVKLSARCVRWAKSEIDGWVKARLQERGTGAQGLRK